MARPLRLEFPGAFYHITSRGNARQNIFVDDTDRLKFLAIFADVNDRYNWTCHAYCLMSNHYHLLLETSDPNLSLGMRQLNGQYTQAFNRNHRRVGHAFQGRYKSIIIEKDTHLLELCRYVVLNPVAAGIVEEPGQWKWSSYQSTVTPQNRDRISSPDWILSQFSTQTVEARKLYRQFVADGLKAESPWRRLQAQTYLGRPDFIAKMQKLLGEKQDIKEIPRKQRYPSRPYLEEIFRQIASKDERNRCIIKAHTSHGYTLKEIADYLRIHYTTVSKVIKKVRGNT